MDETLPPKLPRDFQFPSTGKPVVPIPDVETRLALLEKELRNLKEKRWHKIYPNYWIDEQLLQKAADSLLFYFDSMPSVRVRLTDDRHFKKSRAIAFWRRKDKSIFIRPDYKKRTTWADLIETLRHELVHAWVYWKGLYTEDYGGHNRAFFRKAIEIGLSLNDVLKVHPDSAWIYEEVLMEKYDKIPVGNGWAKIVRKEAPKTVKSIKPVSPKAEKLPTGRPEGREWSMFLFGLLTILLAVVTSIFFWEDILGWQGRWIAIYSIFALLLIVLGGVASFTGLTSYGPEKKGVNEKIEHILQHENKKMGRLASEYYSKKSMARSGLSHALKGEIGATFELANEPHRLERLEKEIELAHKVLMAIQGGAEARKVDVPIYTEMKKAEHLHELEVSKHKELKRFDVDMELLQQLNTIEAILKYNHLRYNQFDEVRSRIMSLIEEEARIEASHESAHVKGQKLALISESKQMYREVMDALKNRLLEAGDGEEISGVEAFTSNFGGLGASSATSSENELPIIVTRSGGEQGSH
jgi:hypothetical protein